MGGKVFKDYQGIVGPLIRAHRRRLEATDSRFKQGAFATEIMEMTSSNLTAVESGKRDLSLTALFKASAALGRPFIIDFARALDKANKEALADERNRHIKQAAAIDGKIQQGDIDPFA